MSRENLDALKYTYANFRQVQASGRFHHRAESSRDGPETGASYFFAAASSQAWAHWWLSLSRQKERSPPVRRDPCQVSLRARRPRLCCHARRPAFHLYQRVETRGQCDADECRL